MTVQAGYWTGVGAMAALALVSGVAESRRTRRRELDAAGWVPWRGLQVGALFVAAALAMLALKA